MAKPFRLTAPKVAENELHEATARLLATVLLPPAMFACYPAGHIQLGGQAAAKLARMGLAQGFPDFLVFCGGHYGIELKAKGGRLSRTITYRTPSGALRTRLGQVEVFPRLRDAGMRIAVCSSLSDVLAALSGWGIPTRVAAND